ncbi:MAG TPA: hypothetical protein VM223_24655 [Planctomycetota bacterium]|nr:hypothetical protein [Planctomycetota bacterium]
MEVTNGTNVSRVRIVSDGQAHETQIDVLDADGQKIEGLCVRKAVVTYEAGEPTEAVLHLYTGVVMQLECPVQKAKGGEQGCG